MGGEKVEGLSGPAFEVTSIDDATGPLRRSGGWHRQGPASIVGGHAVLLARTAADIPAEKLMSHGP